MLGNLKDFISVVQDGLGANNALKQKWLEMQKVSNIFKERPKVSESNVNFSAGAELLEKYQEQWAELHQNSDNNAKAAEEVDKLIREIHDTTKKRLESAQSLANILSQLPTLTAQVAQCIDGLRNVQTLLHTVEEEMVEFEDIVERAKMERWKLDHHYHLTLYKEKKMAALEDIRSKLAKENAIQSVEKERKQLAELQAKSSAAFHQDVSKYLASGSVPLSPTSAPSMTLEQVQLESDSTDLEKFLNS